jgi:hypothetical protein
MVECIAIRIIETNPKRPNYPYNDELFRVALTDLIGYDDEMRKNLKEGFGVKFINLAVGFPATGVVDNDIIYPMSVRDIKKVDEIHKDHDFDIKRDKQEARNEGALSASRFKELQMENEIAELKKQLEAKQKPKTVNVQTLNQSFFNAKRSLIVDKNKWNKND